MSRIWRIYPCKIRFGSFAPCKRYDISQVCENTSHDKNLYENKSHDENSNENKSHDKNLIENENHDKNLN